MRRVLAGAFLGAFVLLALSASMAASPAVVFADSKPKVSGTISWWPSKVEFLDPNYDPDDPNHDPSNRITETKMDAGAKTVKFYLHKKGLPPTVKAVRSDERAAKSHRIGKGYKHWVATIKGEDADPVYQYLISPERRVTVKACNAAGCTTTPPFDQ